jgi:TMEM175 potassium channel family protein
MTELSVGRLVAFTDGVFAIAITLLVLNFDEPTGPDSEVLHQLTDQWPALLAYVLSFVVIGRFWIVHHRVYVGVRRLDSGLLMLNLVYLAFVVLIPFTTEVLGDYSDTTEAVVLYGGTLGGVALFNWLMIRHALVRDHVHPDSRPATAPFAGGPALIVPAVFLLSVPVGFVSPLASELMWAALGLAWPLHARRAHAAQRTGERDTAR